MFDFLKKHVLILLLIGVVVLQHLQIRGLREELRNPLVAPRVEEAAKAGTPQAPVTLNVEFPNLPSINVPPALVFTQPAVPSLDARPAEPPRVVAQTEPVFCRTREECERILQAAPQTIQVMGFVRRGTVVPVEIDGKVVNAPLAEDYRFSIDLALSERGVFHAVLPVDGPLGVTRVETRTVVDEKRAEPRLPYNLAFTVADVIVTNAGTVVFTGPTYQNYAYGGVYTIGVGYGWPGFAVRLGFDVPIR